MFTKARIYEIKTINKFANRILSNSSGFFQKYKNQKEF